MKEYENELEYLLWLERNKKPMYELTITTKPEEKIRKEQIKDLKEMRDILEEYKEQTIEVELHKIKEKIK